MRIDTKAYPLERGVTHRPEGLKEMLTLSLGALGKHKIRVFYLHAPDRSVPFEETLEGVNDLYQAGYL